MIKQLYLASPFFNSLELEEVKKIENLCRDLEIKVFSPRRDNLFDKGDPTEKAKEVFKNNIKAMEESDLAIVNIENRDPGTMFEMGYMYSIGVPMLAYSPVHGRQLNLMLSQSCMGYVNGFANLADTLVRINSGNYKPENFDGQIL